MAYSDYGAFVYCNGTRREDKEDVALFATDEETFGTSSTEIPSGARIWAALEKALKDGKVSGWLTTIHHGTMGDGSIRVLCHKQSLPEVYELLEDGTIQKIDIQQLPEFKDKEEIESFEWGTISFEYKGYKFFFASGEPNIAEMTEPDGTHWECNYDYWYGAGFED